MISSTLRSSEEDYGPDFPFFKERSFSWSCARGRRSVPNTPPWERPASNPAAKYYAPTKTGLKGLEQEMQQRQRQMAGASC
jgi:hypothetical protein